MFVGIEKLILKSVWKCKQSKIAKAIFKKRNRVGGIRLPDLKTYCKATVNKTVALEKYTHRSVESAVSRNRPIST